MCSKRSMTEREAHTLINAIKRRQHKSADKHIPKRAYYCETCKAWHVTKLAVWRRDDE